MDKRANIGACEILGKREARIFEKFYDTHLLLHSGADGGRNEKIVSLYKNAVEALLRRSLAHNDKEINSIFKKLFVLNVKNKTPYVVAINEINYLKNVIVETLLEQDSNEVVDILKIFNNISNLISKLYLSEYANTLVRINQARITGMSDILKRNVISHYKDHLDWVSRLSLSIVGDKKEEIPEVNPKLCNFGKWLDNEAKLVIQNNSRYKAIISLHDELHYFAEKIKTQFETKDYHAFLSYLEKCELISLNIGTELALIDNILLNKMVTKDPLTKSLNRNALKQIFESQYEIAFATSNSMVMAMCDLDHFKKINDNFGHLAGDKMLIEFVKIVKRRIRNSDILVRFGGEEFVIILPAATKEQGLFALNRIREEFAAFVLEFEGRKVNTTVSMGMIEIAPDEYYNIHKLEEYLSLVDKKLYIAKNSGRNQIYA